MDLFNFFVTIAWHIWKLKSILLLIGYMNWQWISGENILLKLGFKSANYKNCKDDVIQWGSAIVIPFRLTLKVLQEQIHVGTVSVEALAGDSLKIFFFFLKI